MAHVHGVLGVNQIEVRLQPHGPGVLGDGALEDQPHRDPAEVVQRHLEVQLAARRNRDAQRYGAGRAVVALVADQRHRLGGQVEDVESAGPGGAGRRVRCGQHARPRSGNRDGFAHRHIRWVVTDPTAAVAGVRMSMVPAWIPAT